MGDVARRKAVKCDRVGHLSGRVIGTKSRRTMKEAANLNKQRQGHLDRVSTELPLYSPEDSLQVFRIFTILICIIIFSGRAGAPDEQMCPFNAQVSA